jgi:phosphatidylserine decarboxylase
MKKIAFYFIKILPRKLFGDLLKKIFEFEKPEILSEFVKLAMIKLYKINLDDAEKNINEYKSFQQFFCRKLKKHARKIDSGIVSPVDGKITQADIIKKDYSMTQVKGLTYSLKNLIPFNEAEDFENGWYCTIYLAPYNYHRIHTCCDGRIDKMFYQPGEFWPVNTITTENQSNLMCQNERITTFFQTEKGKIAMVKVAAFGVGDIKLTYLQKFNNISYKKQIGWTEFDEKIFLQKGDEIGMFAFGSTVIMLFDKNFEKPDFELIKNKEVEFGNRII